MSDPYIIGATAAAAALVAVLGFSVMRGRRRNPLTGLEIALDQAIADEHGGRFPDRVSGLPPRIASKLATYLRRSAGPSSAPGISAQDALTQLRVTQYKKKRLEAVLEALPDGVAVLDPTAVCTFANGKLEPLAGLEPRHAVGRKLHEWCPTTELLSRFSRQSDGSVQVYRVEQLEYTPPFATDRTLRLAAYPLLGSGAEEGYAGTLLLWRDITLEMLAQKARGDFVAHVSHELKSPLNILSMYSEMLMDDAGDDPAIRVEATNVIHDEVERLAALINNLLSITKIEMGSISLERKRVKFRDFLEDIYNKVMRDAQDDSLQGILKLPPDMSAVYVDKDLLSVAVSNLLTNAIKYNRPGGSVELSAEETDDQFVVHVKDSGIGISPGDLERVFEKFYRSDSDEVRKRGGHGLGLALAKQIFDLHHSTVKVESTMDVGTEFTVTFIKTPILMKQTV